MRYVCYNSSANKNIGGDPMSWLESLDKALSEIAQAFGIGGSVFVLGVFAVLFVAFCVIVYRRVIKKP